MVLSEARAARDGDASSFSLVRMSAQLLSSNDATWHYDILDGYSGEEIEELKYSVTQGSFWDRRSVQWAFDTRPHDVAEMDGRVQAACEALVQVTGAPHDCLKEFPALKAKLFPDLKDGEVFTPVQPMDPEK